MRSLLEINSKKIPKKFKIDKMCYPISLMNIIGTGLSEPQLKGIELWRYNSRDDYTNLNLESISDVSTEPRINNVVYYNTLFTFFSYSNFKRKCQRSHFYSFARHKFMNSERRRSIKYKYI